MNQKPLNNYIVVKPFPKEKSTFLMQQERPSKGEVISANDNSKLVSGDIVMFSSNTGVPFPVDGEDYLLMRETEIFCVEGKNNVMGEKIELLYEMLSKIEDCEFHIVPVTAAEMKQVDDYVGDYFSDGAETLVYENKAITLRKPCKQLTKNKVTLIFITIDK